MPARAVMRMISGTHELWYRLSGGRIGGRLGHLPILLLTTTGAKTGQERVAPVVYTRDGDRYVIVASMGGAPEHPSWYANLVANPIVKVELGTDTFQARATVADRAQRIPIVQSRDRGQMRLRAPAGADYGDLQSSNRHHTSSGSRTGAPP